MRLGLRVVAGLMVATLVHSQCITQFDDLTPPNYVDLQHVLPFSIRLFKELLPYTGNFLMSPYSIWNTLVMTYFGTNGETQVQMEKVLQLTNKIDTLALYKSLSQHIQLHESYENPLNYIFDVANGVCVQDKRLIRDCVGQLLSRGLQTVDFHKAEAVAVTINQFINKTSRSNIPLLVRPYDLNYGEMMLINAVYFKGLWHRKFDSARTRLERFYTTRQRRYFVDMMVNDGEYRIGFSDELDAKVLEIPFKGKRASMYVFLPEDRKSGRELEEMLKKMEKGSLLSAIRILDRRDVALNFPKFKYKRCIGSELRLALMRMGIRELFTEGADLTTFVPGGGLMVRDEIHKAKMEINEDGDEEVRSKKWDKARPSTNTGEEPEQFICNRPFLFVILDSYTSNILFMGVFRHP